MTTTQGGMEARLTHSTLRPFRGTDVPSVVRHANDRRIWRNLRDVFPHPYGEDDALLFMQAFAPGDAANIVRAIDVRGEAVGAIGIHRQSDVLRRSAEIGFWLGAEFWGRGIVTEAAAFMTDLAFREFDVCRVFARVFGWNGASARVLEKAGFTREAVHRLAITKDGESTDEVIYARVMESRALVARQP